MRITRPLLRLIGGLAGMVLACTTMSVGTAAAAPLPVVGPGSGFVTTGGIDDLTVCSIAAVGYDDAGRLVALTAGHCILRPGLPVTLVGSPTAPVGTTAVGHWGPDYGVIVLDPTAVTPVASLGGVTVTDIGTGSVGQPVCKTGLGSGLTCGSIVDFRGSDLMSDALTVWGDSGGPLVIGTTLVGIASHASGAPLVSPTAYASAPESLRLLSASGAPGAGFRPV
ncbi:S1 family peptidase [Rhodococcus sp. BS-15]|uniref:S1 family peptidase n=1 Tax=Rhodococcus sp. BS-15 TaxID=1304954 RepID=UPI000B0BBE09|nr:S1 family peptidase [Rhodococcus sp. BS-15]